MPSLKEQLSAPEKREAVIDDACRVLDQEVADKSGISGIAIKTAFSVVKSIKPGFVRQAVSDLLDSFLDALDPLYQEALTQGRPPGDHLKDNASRMAQALLAITDKRAEKAKTPAVKKAYDKLRPTAEKHVEAAAPRLAAMVERHVGR